MTLGQVSDSLDEAIARSARRSLTQLIQGLDAPTIGSQIIGALQSLKKLSEREKPKYDAWDAVIYALWYQPGQVNLAYSLSKALLGQTREGESYLRLDDNWKLHVDDFGCGAWAMQFGLALALADLKHPLQGFPVVTVSPNDESEPMMKMGAMLWKDFCCSARDELAEACRAISGGAPSSGVNTSTETWLTALHVTYEEGRVEREREFQRRGVLLNPDEIIATTRFNQMLLPQLPNGYVRQAISSDLVIGDLCLFPNATKLRKQIFDDLVRNAIPDGAGKDFAKDWLTKRQTRWQSSAVKTAHAGVFRSIGGHAVLDQQPAIPGLAIEDQLTDSIPSDRPSKVGLATATFSHAKEILNYASGFMDAYDFTLNPYSGCSFGCTYCYAAFFSRTPGERDNWGHWVKVKENAVELLRKEKFRKRQALDGKSIYMSTVTDPYQPIERKLRLTRGLLEVMADGHKPKLVVQTRSPDVARDIDLFKRIEENGGRVQVNMTVTTDDEDIRRTFEPFCPSNSNRLQAIGGIESAGIESCITMTPILLINDPERFANDLLATGVGKFIIQPFHFGKGKFTASTREEAIGSMARKLRCEISEFRDRYEEHYRHTREVLKDRLPSLGDGKIGFKPPF